MTPAEALNQAIDEIADHPYIKDPPKLDVWDTVREYIARGQALDKGGAGDCDGKVLYCLWRAEILSQSHGCWYFIAGLLDPFDPATDGHAWAEIRLSTGKLWADPTWGHSCVDPGWFSGRRALKSYRVENELMIEPTDYLLLP